MIIFIMHPPELSHLKSAAALGSNIGPDCDLVRMWDYEEKNICYETSFNSETGVWGTDFNIKHTDPVTVNVVSATNPIIWPYDGQKSVDTGNKSGYADVNIPMPVYYHVQNASKGDYDFSQTDAKNSPIKFKAWITGRENEVLTHEDYGCGFEQVGDVFSAVYINLGNFVTQWTDGDEVNFLVTEDGLNDKSVCTQGKGSYVINRESKAVFRGFELKIKGSGKPIILGTPAGVEESVPYTTALYQNYPNPFNPLTTIRFSLRSDCHAQLEVYNYNGQIVKSLVDGNLSKGLHSAVFNADNLGSGVYYYTLKTDSKTITKKMLILK
jgi:hypothetical protein